MSKVTVFAEINLHLQVLAVHIKINFIIVFTYKSHSSACKCALPNRIHFIILRYL